MSEWLSHNLKQRTGENNLPFQVSFNFQPFSPGTFKEESIKVCVDLHEKHGDNLYLAFSGGSDSEYIMNLFLELKLPITPVIVSCPFNQFDIQPAFSYCERNNIKPVVLSYGDEYIKIAHEKIYNKGLMSPIGLTPLLVYDHVKELGGKVVSGQGEPLPITNRGGSTDIRSIIQMYEFEFYMDIYAEGQPAPFYAYNQSIFYSYMNEVNKSLDLQFAKCMLYNIPFRKKTYWKEEIYQSIRQSGRVMPGNFVQFDANLLKREMESKIL